MIYEKFVELLNMLDEDGMKVEVTYLRIKEAKTLRTGFAVIKADEEEYHVQFNTTKGEWIW